MYDRDETCASLFISLNACLHLCMRVSDLTQAIEGKVCLIGAEVRFEEAASLKQVACQTLAMKHSSKLHASQQECI